MKRHIGIGFWLAAVTALVGALPAEAQMGGRDGARRPGRFAQEQPFPGRGRDMLPHEPRREEFRPPDGYGHGPGRLSPDERRQLRQDIHEAGRDIYPRRARPGF